MQQLVWSWTRTTNASSCDYKNWVRSANPCKSWRWGCVI